MPYFITPHGLALPPAPGLLSLPPPPVARPVTQAEIECLTLLTALTGAPTAIPPDLWHTPVRALSLQATCDLLKQIGMSLTERIPFLAWELVEWEEDAEILSHFLQIPVAPVGIDICNGEVVGCGALLTWVAALAGYGVEELPYPLPDEIPIGFEVAELSLLPDVEAANHPLSALADVLNLLNHTTGTFFLDACPFCWQAEGDEITEWTDENLAWLEADAKRTLAILARIEALEAWVKAEPQGIALVWQTLLDAHAARVAASGVV